MAIDIKGYLNPKVSTTLVELYFLRTDPIYCYSKVAVKEFLFEDFPNNFPALIKTFLPQTTGQWENCVLIVERVAVTSI